MNHTEPATILIVDDQPTNLNLLQTQLRAGGHKILIATSGEAALEQAQWGQPDLIVLDIKMPGIDGYETCRQLKQNPDLAEIPVIFLTALEQTADKLTGFAVGGVDYITKPSVAEEVQARVNTHLALRRLQQTQIAQTARLQAISDGLTTFLQHGQLIETASLLVARACQLSDSEHGVFLLRDRPRENPDNDLGRVRVIALAGTLDVKAHNHALFERLQSACAQGVSPSVRQGECGALLDQVFNQAEPVLCNGPEHQTARDFVLGAGEQRHMLAQPILHQNHVVGVMALANRQAGYGQQDQVMLQALAQTAAVVVECAWAEQRLQISEQGRQVAESRAERLQQDLQARYPLEAIVGRSRVMRDLQQQITQVAATDTTVLILGETGVGKELVARTLHQQSRRRDRPLISINCAALPTDLVESELFGHEKGAFTSAGSQRKGRFELADGGTLFLDEIGDMPLAAQSKLLRILQEQRFERVGGEKTLAVDVRIIAASRRDLPARITEGLFREDLFYRLNVFPLQVPPLRDRSEDIADLVAYFIDRTAAKLGRAAPPLAPTALRRLQAYRWPGNVRELENVIERAFIVNQGEPLAISTAMLAEATSVVPSDTTATTTAQDWNALIASRPTMDELQYHYLQQLLAETNEVVEGEQGAAKIAGLNPNTLRARLRKFEKPS